MSIWKSDPTERFADARPNCCTFSSARMSSMVRCPEYLRIPRGAPWVSYYIRKPVGAKGPSSGSAARGQISSTTTTHPAMSLWNTGAPPPARLRRLLLLELLERSMADVRQVRTERGGGVRHRLRDPRRLGPGTAHPQHRPASPDGYRRETGDRALRPEPRFY
jgi:hypothetical protein